LFFSIEAPDRAYDQLETLEKPPSPSDRVLLQRLSKDFLNFDERVKGTVARELKTAQFSTPIVSGVLAIFLTIVANMVATYLSGVNDLRTKLEGLEKALAVNELKSRVEKLEKQGLNLKP
jgi:hypothetical protein